MLWFIIFVPLVAIGGFLVTGESEWTDSFDFGEACFGFFIGGLFGALPALVLNGLCLLWVHPVWHQTYSLPLQSISTGDQLHGSFFLGSGTINDKQVYNYFVKEDDGSFYRTWVYSDEASIMESSDAPHIEKWEQNSSNPWLSIFAGSQDPSYTFYVPQGSVVQDYTLRP